MKKLLVLPVSALALAACEPAKQQQPPIPPSPPASPAPGAAAPAPAAPAAPSTANPTAANIEARVRKIVKELLGAEAAAAQPTRTWLQLGADSLDHVELIMALEEEFDVSISDEAAVKIPSIAGAVQYLSQHAKK